MKKSPKTQDRDPTGPQFAVTPAEGFDSPAGRSLIAAADFIIAVDPGQKTRTLIYKREIVEAVPKVLFVPLDSATEELDRLDTLVREIKGHSCFRPADLFPEFVIDVASFGSEPDLLDPVRVALDEIRNQHRTLLPPVQLRFYYSIPAAGFTTANKELRLGTQEAGMPVAYIYSVVGTLGELLYRRLPAGLIKPTRCLDIVHGVGANERKLGVRCRSLLVRSTPHGKAYHSRRMPRIRFGADKRERLVAFSKHALERFCERTVYDWKTFGGQGDVFAFLENCVYFEDCTEVRGEPSFVVYNSCIRHFHSWGYVEHVLGRQNESTEDALGDIVRSITDSPVYYRVGYCPVTFHGDLAVATTLLFPGMSLKQGTPEGKLIERSGLPAAEVARMKARVESQLSMKALADSGDFTLVKWFHDNGVPQVASLDKEVFRYE